VTIEMGAQSPLNLRPKNKKAWLTKEARNF